MQIARDIAGYSMADADALRKAMGKKIPGIMRKEREKFVAGSTANGNSPRFGEELFESIEGFAGYGFNKSHSAAYGLLAYQTAYLKRHYPAEYMAALLTSSRRDKDKTAVYLNECRTKGIEVLTPSANMSESDFTVRDGKIVFGLSAVRNLGEGMVAKIVNARNEGGPFVDFQDFADRVHPSILTKKLVPSLIKAGAFDQMGHPRMGLMLAYEKLLDLTLERRRNEDRGQYSLFIGGQEAAPELDEHVEIPDLEWDKKKLLSSEKEMLGLYVSDHPLMGLESAIRRLTTCPIAELSDQPDGAQASVCGIVGSITRRYTRAGELMLFFDLEDLEGSVEVLAFPKTVARSEGMIEEDAVLLVEGRVSLPGDDVKLRAHGISRPNLAPPSELRLRVPADALSQPNVDQLKHILVTNPGTAPVLVDMTADNGRKLLRLDDRFRVDVSSSTLHAEIRRLFGEKALV